MKKRLFAILVSLVLVLDMMPVAAFAEEGDMPTYKITINQLHGNPFDELYGSEFRKYDGTEFNSRYGDDIWVYEFGKGKLFINVDPNNYPGGGFMYWTTVNDPDSVYSFYAFAKDVTTGEYITSYHIGDIKEGYSVAESSGTWADIDFQVSSEATLGYANVKLDKTTYTYTGKSIKPHPVVTLDGVTLTEGVDYVVRYEYNKNVGDDFDQPTVIITTEEFARNHFNKDLQAEVIYKIDVPFKIVKAKHPGIKAKAKTATVKYSKVKSKAQTVKMSQVVSVTGKKGTLKYSIKPIGSKAKKALKYKNGKISIKKGTKKGTYKFKVTVKDKGSRNYIASGTKTITTIIVVK